MDNMERQGQDVSALKNHLEEAAKLLSVMKRKACLSLLCLLAEGRWTVTELAQQAGLSQPVTSQCLHKMKDLKLLSVSKVMTTNYYAISSPLVLKLLSQLNDLFGAEAESEAAANKESGKNPESVL